MYRRDEDGKTSHEAKGASPYVSQTHQAGFAAYPSSRPPSSSSTAAMSKSTYYDPTSESRSEYRASSRDGNAAYPTPAQYAPRSPAQHHRPAPAYSAAGRTSPGAATSIAGSSQYHNAVDTTPRHPPPYSPSRPAENSPPAYSAHSYQHANGQTDASHLSPSRPVDATPSKPVDEPRRERPANPMSFMNILSDNPEPSRPEAAAHPAQPAPPAQPAQQPTPSSAHNEANLTQPKALGPEISSARAASPAAPAVRESTPKVSMENARSYTPKEKRGDTPSSGPGKKAKLPKTGVFKAKPSPVDADKERSDKIKKAMSDIEALENMEPHVAEMAAAKAHYKQLISKRRLKLSGEELGKRKRQRLVNTAKALKPLDNIMGQGQQSFAAVNITAVEQEVLQQDIADEKERKKDMQRKRRREKALETEKSKAEDLRAKADIAESDGEKAKLLKEAAKAEKKARETQRKIDGVEKPEEINEVAPSAPNLEGGTEGSFLLDNGLSPEPPKKKNKTGVRLKKSKTQKEAEKATAVAAHEAEMRGDPVLIAPKEELKGTPAKEGKEAGKKGRRKKEDEKPEEPERESTPVSKDPFSSKAFLQIYDQIWRDIARKDIPKVYRIKANSLDTRQSNLRKTAQLASKEARRWQQRTNKSTKDVQARAKRSMREMMNFWKRNERQERDLRKNAERQELDAARRAEAEREANRQKRKLNFLISQTELYSHFIGKKIRTDEVERSTDDKDVAVSTQKVEDDANAAHTIDLPDSNADLSTKVTNFDQLDFDAEDESVLKEAAMANAQAAIQEAQDKARAFNNNNGQSEDAMAQFDDGEMNFQNPTSLGDVVLKQPAMLTVSLKDYQLKGLNWLANLYEQGINGILADEMGLGKTIQSICVMAYLAETHNIWGPFLVVAPASTLHNWQQEISRFVPDVKVLPYWGTSKDRKVLRKFWDRKHITYTKESPFHVLVTSYQLVVQDAQYFQKIRWQYMILDEAQNIKSSQSARWKTLLGFHCRNRLLLTGTPIQNNMQELWALLHFIMPSLFDSHDEFSDWFSKDIESHAQSNTKLNEDQLRRLHMILKPFMLRRVKQHVQKELGDKIELDVFCDLTYRQRAYYSSLRNKISIMDLIERAAVGDDQDAATLMNLVMQFRKVCNHPDLFERAETSSPLSMVLFAETASFLREGNNVDVRYSTRNAISYELPRLLCSPEGRLDLPGPGNAKAGFRNKYLGSLMNIWTQDNIRQSSKEQDAFSWLRFADTTAGEVSDSGRVDTFTRATKQKGKINILGRVNAIYEDEPDASFTPSHSMLKIVDRNDRRPLADMTVDGHLKSLLNISQSSYEDDGLGLLEQCARPAAAAPPITASCSSRAMDIEKENTFFNVSMRKAIYGWSLPDEEMLLESSIEPVHYPVRDMLPEPISRRARYTNIQVPSMQRFVTDSGKLAKLDELLRTLKAEGHRVLLYFQMTRMIDLMEEYLTYRNYKYCRLDGSTKLEDRRDTVADFQTRPEIFIFLLSTRAGGLGINLTSADTVIFYDSDWNPTIDSQAMDRAHRLGQTKQVTVYRMITSGTIEERIRKRSLQKEEMQRVVMTGGAGAAVNFDSRARENKTKDIAMWLADDEQAELIEKKEKEMLEKGEDPSKKKKKTGGRRKEMNMDDFYHEGEGHFDDSAKPSGAATPMDEDVDAPKPKRGPRGGKGISKKAKTAKQRLAIADGAGDI